jgi:hypothetical protein
MENKFTVKRKLINLSRLIFKPVFPIMIVLFASTQSFSQNSVSLRINPSTTNVQVNQTFTVDVLVDFGTGTVAGVEAYLNFDPTYLEVVSTSVPPSTVTALPNESVAFQTVAFMNANGQVDYGRFTLAPVGSHPNADFVLFSVQFRALAVPPPGPTSGNTSIIFNTSGGRISNAVETVDILDQLTNGTVTISNILCTAPTGLIANTSTCNGQPFDLFLQSATGTSPFSLVVNGITYNNVTVGSGTPFATVTPPTEKIWPANPIPAGFNDDDPVELATKFRSVVDGFVTGIRFYKPVTTNTGNYIGRLYAFNYATNNSTLMASVTFPAASMNTIGWKEALFASPIPIEANTVYLAAYFNPDGDYAVNSGTIGVGASPFLNEIVSGNLRGLQDTAFTPGLATGLDLNGNGVFRYGAGDNWGTYEASCYWVDLMFTPGQFTYDLTSITDASPCTATGSPIQSLSVTSVSCSVLPITLANISARPQGKNIIVDWATASESENKGFELQRSSDNLNWEGITFINGAGNSTSTINYSYEDKGLYPSRYYYRLKQVDFDGRYKFSVVVSAMIDGKAEYELKQNFPNPLKDETTIRYILPETSKVNLTIFDMNGRPIKVLVNGTKGAGMHAQNFYPGALPAGVYYYKLQAGNFTSVKKLVIQ